MIESMNRSANPVGKLIRKCGGAEAIAEASRVCGWRRIKKKSVYAWRHKGIHWIHWPLITSLSGASIEEIYRACIEVVGSRYRGVSNRE